jgi:amidase
MTGELWTHGAADLASAMRARHVSSRQVLEAHIARVAAVNPRVNAITAVLETEARAAADAADEALQRGDAVGPLHGVPVSVKVNIDVAGTPTTDGMPAFANALPTGDAPLVATLRAAGAIPFARTNMPDLGLRWHTDSALHGATLNPWDPALTPGGSSGGEAVAVATGMSPLGIGNDVGGSVRWPSQCCGTAAIRPTLGRIPNHASTLPMELPIAFRMFMTDGPIARHVRDLRLALRAMCGTSPLDPWSVAAATVTPARPLRVAVTTDPGAAGCDATIAAGVRRAADVLSAAGCVVEVAEPPALLEAHELWGTLLGNEARTLIAPFVRPIISADAMTVIEHLVDGFPAVDLAGYMMALAQRTRVAREWEVFFERYDVLLGPVGCRSPFAIGHDLTAAGMADVFRDLRLVTVCNLLGLPAAVVPVGIGNGLPLAVQLISARFREDSCLAAGQLIEDDTPAIIPIDPRPAGSRN